MHAICSICGDVFTGIDPEIIRTTTCGHIFHEKCLFKWINSSKTCPQCRGKVEEKTSIRLYFELSAEVVEDSGLLQNKLQSANFQLSIKETELKKEKEQYKIAKKQAVGLRHKLLISEETIRNHETIVSSLQDRIEILKTEKKSIQKTHQKLEELSEKLKMYKYVDELLNSTKADISETLDMMKDIKDPNLFCACISTLKRELYNMKSELQNTKGYAKHKESKVAELAKEIGLLKEKMSVTTRTLECMRQKVHKAENDNKELMQQVKRATKMSTSNPCSESKCVENDDKESRKLSSSIFRSGEHDIFSINVDDDQPVQDLVLHTSKQLDKDISNFAPIKNLMFDMEVPRNNSYNKNSYSLSPVKKYIDARPKDRMLLSKPRWQPSKSASSIPQQQCYDGLGGHSKEEHISLDKAAILRLTEKTKKMSKPPPPKKLKMENYGTSITDFLTKKC